MHWMQKRLQTLNHSGRQSNTILTANILPSFARIASSPIKWKCGKLSVCINIIAYFIINKMCLHAIYHLSMYRKKGPSFFCIVWLPVHPSSIVFSNIIDFFENFRFPTTSSVSFISILYLSVIIFKASRWWVISNEMPGSYCWKTMLWREYILCPFY